MLEVKVGHVLVAILSFKRFQPHRDQALRIDFQPLAHYPPVFRDDFALHVKELSVSLLRSQPVLFKRRHTRMPHYFVGYWALGLGTSGLLRSAFVVVVELGSFKVKH